MPHDFTFLFLTSSRDPGIIPRNKEAPEAEGLDMLSKTKLPVTKDSMSNSVRLVCFTVLHAPLTAQHATTVSKDLITTVNGWDNLRNYPYFIGFISTSTLLCLYVSWVSMLEVHGKMLLMVIMDDIKLILCICIASKY
ncbi:hypothetical protein HID58_063222 [Brassica napus]|uniref:CASP-like protein n=1 Tax=Brassica napus TaxID=3708 RepID=A0ABQ8A3Q1_BRANA|nr:hypothetical protein HID58_063222 [Brassica napus]